MQKIILKALNDKRKVLVIRKIQRTIKDSIWTLALSLLTDAGLYDFCRVNRSDYEIELPNGSLFLFKGLDDPEKIKSIVGITDIVIEEATELNLEDYTQLNLRLRPKEKDAQIYMMFNPVSKANWVYQYFFVEKNTDEKTYIKQTNYKDNKFLPEEYIEELKKLEHRNPAYYRIYVLGEFATLDKLVFPVYEKRLISKEEIEGLHKWAGLDFGFTNDPSALVWGYYDEENKIIYITGEYVKKGMLNDEIEKTIKDLGLQKDGIYADSASPKDIEDLKRRGIRIYPAIKGQDSVIHGLSWMQQNKIIIDERCFKTIEEFENYTWRKDKKTGEYINEPVDAYNHAIDGIRYGLNQFIKGTKGVQIFDKRQFLYGGTF